MRANQCLATFFCFSIVSSLSSIPFISCLISLIARFLSLCLSLLKHFSMSDIVIVIALGTDLIVKLIAIVTINRYFFSVGRRCFRVSLELKRNRLLLFPVCVCVCLNTLLVSACFCLCPTECSIQSIECVSTWAIGNKVVTNNLAFITKTVDHDTVFIDCSSKC